jgi:general secretion pathway protein L
MRTLRLHLCPLAELGADSALDYEVLDAARAVARRGRAVLAELPRLPRTELVIAAPDVLLVEVALPPLSGARLRAALPALAEPHLLGDVEAAHVVAARPAGGSRTTLAALDRGLLQRTLELLRRAKLTPISATPEPLTLPITPGRWRLRLGTAYGCLRTAPFRGLATTAPAAGEPPVELRLALEQAGDARAQAVEVEGPCDGPAWSTALGLPVVPVEAPPARAEPVVLELLQYELAPQLVSWRAWRTPAVLAVLCLLTWIVGLNVEAALMRREESALRAQMTTALREVVPSLPVVLDPLKQMQRAVADLRVGAGTDDPREFLPLATVLARSLALNADTVRLLEFRGEALRVDFDPRALAAPNAREHMIEQASAAGLTARLTENTLSVRPKENRP